MSKHNSVHEEDLDVSGIVNSDVHHEEKDINPTPVYKFFIWLTVGTALTYVLAYYILKPAREYNAGVGGATVEHVQRPASDRLPPEPRLQLAPGHAAHPLEEIRNYKDSLYQILHSYAYIDKKAGTVRIPIEVAKELVVQRGLPTSAVAGQADPSIVMVPEGSSSGRTLIALHQRVPGATTTVIESGIDQPAQEGSK
jgi:hypothetical protein